MFIYAIVNFVLIQLLRKQLITQLRLVWNYYIMIDKPWFFLSGRRLWRRQQRRRRRRRIRREQRRRLRRRLRRIVPRRLRRRRRKWRHHQRTAESGNGRWRGRSSDGSSATSRVGSQHINVDDDNNNNNNNNS